MLYSIKQYELVSMGLDYAHLDYFNRAIVLNLLYSLSTITEIFQRLFDEIQNLSS